MLRRGGPGRWGRGVAARCRLGSRRAAVRPGGKGGGAAPASGFAGSLLLEVRLDLLGDAVLALLGVELVELLRLLLARLVVLLLVRLDVLGLLADAVVDLRARQRK